MHGPAIELVPLGDLLMYVGMGLLSFLGGLSAYVPRRFRGRGEQPTA